MFILFLSAAHYFTFFDFNQFGEDPYFLTTKLQISPMNILFSMDSKMQGYLPDS